MFKDASVSTASDIKDDVANDLGSTWRGLSTEEWRYLMGYDHNNGGVQSPRRAVAWYRYVVVDDTNLGEGHYVLIFPDGFKETDWTDAMGKKPTTFEHNGILWYSDYTTSNFTAMWNAGIVILPHTGYWSNDYNFLQSPNLIYYWSCTCADANGAMAFHSNTSEVRMNWMNKTEYNFPVRLVRNVE